MYAWSVEGRGSDAAVCRPMPGKCAPSLDCFADARNDGEGLFFKLRTAEPSTDTLDQFLHFRLNVKHPSFHSFFN
jgi:hypothetical protein